MQTRTYKKAQDLYLDMDGVLVCIQQPYPTLNPHALEFIAWAQATFERVMYLTCWTEDSIKAYLPNLPALEYREWLNRKTEAIDYKRSFYWLEDGITSEEKKELAAKKVLDSYVFIDPYNYNSIDTFRQNYQNSF